MNNKAKSEKYFILSKTKLLSVICSPKNVKWDVGGYEKPRGASQLLGEGYVRYSSILASVDGDAYLLFLGAVGEGGHQLPHGGGVEVAVGGFQGVAKGLPVDGKATHGVAVASLGTL